MSAGGEGPTGFASDPAPEQTFPCGNCGHGLPTGTPICGNCGTIVGGASTGPGVPEPLAASGIRPGAVIVLALAVALAGGLFFARGAISDAITSMTDAFEDATDGAEVPPPDAGEPGGDGGGGGNGGRGNGGGRPGVQIAYRHVPEVVRALRAGGIPCSPARVDSTDEYVETGSCQSNGSHVQINLYFTPAGIEFAKDFYADFAFASVHADNWWISGEAGLMARIQEAIGGKLSRP